MQAELTLAHRGNTSSPSDLIWTSALPSLVMTTTLGHKCLLQSSQGGFHYYWKNLSKNEFLRSKPTTYRKFVSFLKMLRNHLELPCITLNVSIIMHTGIPHSGQTSQRKGRGPEEEWGEREADRSLGLHSCTSIRPQGQPTSLRSFHPSYFPHSSYYLPGESGLFHNSSPCTNPHRIGVGNEKEVNKGGSIQATLSRIDSGH